jgi:hypothetical protein
LKPQRYSYEVRSRANSAPVAPDCYRSGNLTILCRQAWYKCRRLPEQPANHCIYSAPSESEAWPVSFPVPELHA